MEVKKEWLYAAILLIILLGVIKFGLVTIPDLSGVGVWLGANWPWALGIGGIIFLAWYFNRNRTAVKAVLPADILFDLKNGSPFERALYNITLGPKGYYAFDFNSAAFRGDRLAEEASLYYFILRKIKPNSRLPTQLLLVLDPNRTPNPLGQTRLRGMGALNPMYHYTDATEPWKMTTALLGYSKIDSNRTINQLLQRGEIDPEFAIASLTSRTELPLKKPGVA